MQGGVEQRRVEAVVLGVGGHLVGELHPPVGDFTLGPGLYQSLKGGAVFEAALGEAFVKSIEIYAGGAGRGPGGQVGAGGRVLGGLQGEAAGAVLYPGRVVGGVLGAAEHREGAATRLVGGREGDLNGRPGARGGDQGRGEGQLRDGRAAEGPGRGEHQLHQPGAGKEGGAKHGVVGQPGIGALGEATAEDAPVAVGQRGERAKQGMLGGDEAGGGDIGRAAGGLQPVTLARERVGGEVDPLGGGAGDEGGPVYRASVGVKRAEGGVEFCEATFVSFEGAKHHAALLGAGGGERHAEKRMGADFEEDAEAVFKETLKGAVEAHGLTEVAAPVVGVEGFTGEDATFDGGVEGDGGGLRGDVL